MKMKCILNTDTLKMLVMGMYALGFSACQQDLFDQQRYEEVVSDAYPVAKVDAKQTWNSLTSGVIISDMNVDADVVELQVLTGSPGSQQTLMINSVPVTKGLHTDLVYEVEQTMTNVYAACLCRDGSYIAKQVPVGTQNVDFSVGATRFSKQNTPLRPYRFTYCFDSSFPQPGDFDFNDLVLRVSTKRESSTAVRFDVTIAAVGVSEQLAAAMRLEGMMPSDIDSVEWVAPFMRRDNRENTVMMPMPGKNGYIKARNGQVVIPLFSDAHMAMTNGEYIMDNMQVEHICYNTQIEITNDEITGLSNGRDIASPATATFIVHCKDKFTADNITMRRLDTFVSYYHTGSLWEIHTYAFKTEQVLHQYISKDGNYKDNKIWAILVPGDFRYPVEGVCMGYYYGNVLAGAYQTFGHSFGEWASNHTQALDWFKYPTAGSVY